MKTAEEKFIDLYCEVIKLRVRLLELDECPDCQGKVNCRTQESPDGVISFYGHCCQCDKKWLYNGEEK